MPPSQGSSWCPAGKESTHPVVVIMPPLPPAPLRPPSPPPPLVAPLPSPPAAPAPLDPLDALAPPVVVEPLALDGAAPLPVAAPAGSDSSLQPRSARQSASGPAHHFPEIMAGG